MGISEDSDFQEAFTKNMNISLTTNLLPKMLKCNFLRGFQLYLFIKITFN